MTDTPIRKRMVSEWGLPTEADLPVAVEWPDGTINMWRWNIPKTPPVAWWPVWPVTLPAETEPADADLDIALLRAELDACQAEIARLRTIEDAAIEFCAEWDAVTILGAVIAAANDLCRAIKESS